MIVADFRIISLVGAENCRIHDRGLLRGFELDVYIPSKGIAFEYDGLYWHSEAKKDDQLYHVKKTLACKEKGVRLIHVFEDEWVNKNEICKSRISSVLGLDNKRIYARKCIVKEIQANEANKFISENHIQGISYGKYNYGLFNDGELVSVMTFCGLRRNLGGKKEEGCYELLRFCNKLNTTVIGGAGKLFNRFIKDISPQKVISYADKRWSCGDLYYKLGFEYIHDSKPNYFYLVNGERRNRFNFRKDVLVREYGCPNEMSEKEFCRMNGWYRIYDCGSMKFEYIENKNTSK